jgi:hypothetical protein
VRNPFAALAVVLIGLVVVSARSHAQDLEPRVYSNAPIGLNFLITAYVRSEGGVVFDPTIPLTNANFQINTGVFAYARSFEAWGRAAKLDIAVARVDLSGTAELNSEPIERQVTGWADPRLRVSINLFGSPALSLREMSSWRQDLIVGASLYVWAPVGQYDIDRLVNIGTNRWAVKPELGVSKAAGPWVFEVAAAVSLYGDNDQYLVTQTREQDPVYSLQGGAIYNFSPGAWLALFGTWYEGGRTTVDGVRGNNLQSNSRVGLTLSLPVNRHNSVKLYASSGVFTRTGSDFDVAGISWQYRWGGGL